MKTNLEFEQKLAETLHPVSLSEDFTSRLQAVFTPQIDFEDVAFDRFLGAMNEEQEKQDLAFENNLRKLQPVNVPKVLSKKLTNRVHEESPPSWPSRIFSARQVLWGFVAGAAAACLAIGVFIPHEKRGGFGEENLAHVANLQRETLNVQAHEIVWDSAGMVPCQSFEVTYQDSFSVSDSNGSQLQIKVPAKQNVSIPVEVY